MSVYDEANKLWYDLNKQPTSESVKWTGQHVLNLLSSHDSNVAQINDATGVHLTYREMRMKAIRAAQNLRKRGYKPGDVFGFMVENDDDLTPILIAALCLACPIAPLHPMLTKDEIVHFFRKAKPSIVFCEINACDQLMKALEELSFNVQIFIFGGKVDGYESVESLFGEIGDEDRFTPIAIDPEIDIGAIVCSSGTTGPSKCLGVPFSRSLCITPTKYDSSSVFYCPDSIYWAIGIKPITDSIESGAIRIISSEPFSPVVPLRLIDKYKITNFPVAAFDLIACLKTDLIRKVDLSSVQKIFAYGSKLPFNLVAEIHQYFPNAELFSWYGCTEIGMISTAFYNRGKSDDVGATIMDGCTAKIVDDNGNRHGPKVAGELCIKKKYPFRGYIDDPVANASAIDVEGFYLTGDIGYFDDNGRLFLQDRKKNVLTLFYFDSILLPFELEECLIKMAGVKEVCVVGVPIAGGAVLPAAVIVPKPGTNLSRREIFDKISETFPKRSWLRAGVYFVKSLPKTSNGKLVRREITKTAVEMFEKERHSDPEIRSYVSDIPEVFQKLIWI